MIPNNTIRQALYTALNGNIGESVYTAIPTTVNDYVLISNIRVFEDTAQSYYVYDAIIDIEVVKRYDKAGNKSEASNIALLIDNIIRPSVTGFISIPGWDVCGIWLDNSDEFTDLIEEKKVIRYTLSYSMKLGKS